MRTGCPIRTWSKTGAMQIVGGLLVAAVVIALPASLAFIAPEALGASAFVGDSSAAALHSLDQSLQGSRSNAPTPGGKLMAGSSSDALPCPTFAFPGPSVQFNGLCVAETSGIVRPSPTDNCTTLLL